MTSAELREVTPWIPARTVSRFHVASAPMAPPVAGIYVDTFITPDELALGSTRRLVAKVHDGISAAAREGARVATLGGFTSIVLEGKAPPPFGNMVLTTGNTLTVALIVRGVERAMRLLGRSLEQETLLVIGATGDVGSACARCFAGRTRRLLLAARNRHRLELEAARLRSFGPVTESTDVTALLAQATAIVAVASTPAPCFDLDTCHPDVVVCDAGYPKNTLLAPESRRRRVFWGGMGSLGGGLWSDDGILESFYRFPVPHVIHGCMLEGAVLAMSDRFDLCSTGRGHITPQRADDMWRVSGSTGVSLAPLFDHNGVWPEEGES